MAAGVREEGVVVVAAAAAGETRADLEREDFLQVGISTQKGAVGIGVLLTEERERDDALSGSTVESIPEGDAPDPEASSPRRIFNCLMR